MLRLSAALLLLGLAQEGSIRLEAKLPAPGTRITIEIRSILELKTIIKDSAREQTRESSYLRSEKFSGEVVGSGDGPARAFRVTCDHSKVEHSAPNTPPQMDTTGLDGRTFIVSKTPTTRTVLHEDGSAADEASAVGAWEEFDRLLPKQEVKAGDTWTIEGPELAGLVSTGTLIAPKISLKGKVEKIEGSIATLGFSGTATGTTAEGIDLKFSLEGCALVFDNEKGRPQSLTVKGSMTGGKKVLQPYVPLGGVKPRMEEVGEIRVESKKFEVSVTYK